MGASGPAGRSAVSGVGSLIFLTIGTHEPFDRLLRVADKWIEQTSYNHELVAQAVSPNSGAYIPKNFRIIPHLSPADYEELVLQADLIVSHAGMGSILTAFTHGKPIVIMPRRGHLRETRNDHQYTTVRHLMKRPGLFVAQDEMDFPNVMDKALAAIISGTPQHLSSVAASGFTDALRSFLISSNRS